MKCPQCDKPWIKPNDRAQSVCDKCFRANFVAACKTTKPVGPKIRVSNEEVLAAVLKPGL